MVAEDNVKHVPWQALLEKVEKDLVEHEAKGLELRNVRNYLRKQLGLPAEEIAEVPTVSETRMGIHTGILPKFPRGHFYGFSLAKAGQEVLQQAGGALHTDEILQVLKESGYSIGGDDPRRTLYRSLCRSRRLVLVARNTFDLAERRPKARKTKESKKEGAENEKAQIEQQTEATPETGEGIESN